MAESVLFIPEIRCPVCPAGPMHLAVELKDTSMYACRGCGATLSVCPGHNGLATGKQISRLSGLPDPGPTPAQRGFTRGWEIPACIAGMTRSDGVATMIPPDIEKRALELVTEVTKGFWEHISPNTLQMIVRAVALDMQRDADYRQP